MSKLGIGFLIAALLGAVASGVAGYLDYTKLNEAKSSLTDAQTAQTRAQSEAKKAKDALKGAQDAAADATSKLSSVQSQVDDLNTKLTAAQKEAADATSQISQLKTDADAAKAAFQHVKDVLGDMSPEDAQAAIKKSNDALAANQAEMKILQDQLQASQSQIETLKIAINKAKTGDQAPGITGKVTFVNHAWNFVVLNIGISNGVVPNGELIVYRGREFLGKIKITTVESTSAVADIEPGAKADIQIGDDVLN